MPLYDYRCTECGREVEVMHGIYDNGPQSCQHCGGAMRKALSRPAIHFKGSGWAKKDAAASAKKAKPKASTTGSSGSSTGEPEKSAKSGDGESTKSDSAADSGSTTKTNASTGSSTE